MKLRLLPATAVFLLSSFVAAHAAIGEWNEGEHMRLRLVAARPAAGGGLDAMIEIELDPDWKTYWRTPGDAGIPPRLDFSASSGVSGPAIDFPPPERDDDGFNVSNVYHQRLALPVRFATVDAGDVRLHLRADLGVCREICVPVTVETALDVPKGEADAAATGLIAEARAALPGPGVPGSFEVGALRRDGGDDKDPKFAVEATLQSAADAILFVETPSDWYPSPATLDPASVSGGRAVFRFDADRKTATTPLAGAAIRLTLTQGDASTSRTFTLDPAGASR